MNLADYFENTDGMGVLATSDDKGNVDAALYATAHVVDDETIALIMRPRLSYKNIQSNGRAVYMFVENGPGYTGKRFYIEKIREEKDPKKIDEMRRKPHGVHTDDALAILVYFRVNHIRPLVGDAETR